MQGLVITLDTEDARMLPTLMNKLTYWNLFIQLSHDLDENCMLISTLKIKSYNSETVNKLIRQVYFDGSIINGESLNRFHKITEETTLCDRPDCFRPVAALQYEQVKKTSMYDRHGEEMHLLYRACTRHCGGAAMRVASTLEVDVINEDKKDNNFEHVLIWRGNKNYYAQRIVQQDTYSEGLEQYSSPYLGPFGSREDARSAARNYDF